ncbi:protein CHLOROPLAST IMPORT APPARATUS 2 [Lotus japonicus]|uniref:protein CHLOROPLAST IMPORT APPARATUS 2 n=1 Tax=Lotus japonicus TaxID=34305 RepID=UPI00258FE3F0|nr:protein CHLOROPLAST IMPORT APPARATUS 2 [Lotus japonicus]
MNLEMSSSCLSGAGGRATYGFDLDFVKSPSSWSRTSQSSSSPSSTISESSNSQLAIATRKPRTPRKRPNQTYNEAAALLSTAYPNLFSTKTLKQTPSPTNHNFIKEASAAESSELLFPFRVLDTSSSSYLLHGPIQHNPPPPELKAVGVVPEKPCRSPGEISSRVNLLDLVEDDCGDDFDAESILDEEIEEGTIDSIMGGRVQEDSDGASWQHHPWIGFGGKFDFRLGFPRAGVRALRCHVDDGDWWNFPPVDILQISPKIIGGGGSKHPPEKKKKKKVAVAAVAEKPKVELNEAELPKANASLMLKLNYDDVRSAWSGRGSPFSDDSPASDAPGNDVTARLSQIDLLWDNGGVREASVLRYKEKRRTRLFSKKIRYQVRKVNADRRPRMKGRFVTRLNSSSNAHR